MILYIQENCSWENERWCYLLDLSKQDGQALNQLMIFIRLANQYYEEAKKNAPDNPMSNGGFFTRHVVKKIFAASRYTFEFYNEIVVKGNEVSLLNGKRTLCLKDLGKSGYHFYTNDMRDRKISPKFMESAMIKMRDHKENSLYKDFDSVFLRPKTVKV